MGDISNGIQDGKKWQNYGGSYIKPEDHPLFKKIKGWYVKCEMIGTHGQFEAWNPHNSPGMWKERPSDGWVKITKDYPMIESA